MDISGLINNNSENIVSNIKQESIDVYLFLKKRFSENNVNEDYLFQFLFRSFYRLDNAGLTDDFKSKYFELLQIHRSDKSIDIPALVKILYEFKTLKNVNSIQFSFVSKMVNTIDDSMPIYDSEVARMFEFRVPYTYKDTYQRINKYMEFYAKLSKQYNEFIAKSSLKTALSCLNSNLNGISSLSENKKIDFLVWSAGKLEYKGELNYAVANP